MGSGADKDWVEPNSHSSISNETWFNPLNKQEGGNHYKDKAIQPVEFITANNLGFLEGNVIKYITRHIAKNGAEDIRKAIHYCELILATRYKDIK